MAYEEGPALRCPQCGFELEARARQCHMCLLPVPRKVRSPRARRKQRDKAESAGETWNPLPVAASGARLAPDPPTRAPRPPSPARRWDPRPAPAPTPEAAPVPTPEAAPAPTPAVAAPEPVAAPAERAAASVEPAAPGGPSVFAPVSRRMQAREMPAAPATPDAPPAPTPAAPTPAAPSGEAAPAPAPVPTLDGVPWLEMPPPEPPPDRRPLVRAIALAAAGVLVASVAGLVTLPKLLDRHSYPDQWDPRVAAVVDDVERIRNLSFEHPVAVQFLDEAAFVERLAGEGVVAEEARDELDQTATFLAALGLMQGTGDDLLAEQDAHGADAIVGFYEPSDQKIFIRGTELNAPRKLTLAHELTHALQDQHFDLETLQDDTANPAEAEALRALEEGDARRVEDLYARELSAQEQAELANVPLPPGAGEQPSLGAAPEILSALFLAPYQVGPLFVEALDITGERVVDEAFRIPPTTAEQILNPAAFLDGDEPEPVAGASLASDEQRVAPIGELGAIGWYYVLASRIDAETALDAALGWGGDEMTLFERGGVPCARLVFQGDTDEDTARMGTALGRWVSRMPAGAALVDVDSDVVTTVSCSPGAVVPAQESVAAAAAILEIRAAIAFRLLENGTNLDPAECTATSLAFDPAVQSFLTNPAPSEGEIVDFTTRAEEARAACD